MRHDVWLQDEEGRGWLHFHRPLAIVQAYTHDKVRAALSQVEEAVNRWALFAAGFVAYEAAPAFDPALRVRPATSGLPLLWFRLYRRPTIVEELPVGTDYRLGIWQPSLDRQRYRAAIQHIKRCIAAGYTYQVNYTFHLRAAFEGDPWGLFRQLALAQQGHFAAYIDTGRFAVCSASPELFFRLEGERLTSRPMKGTAARGRTLAEDEAQRAWLHNSEKNRAENVMIVDMIRNDMGRIARFGSVRVPSLFEVERYPTVLQMTSTVTCQTSASVSEVMAALFPCASVTGAPKVRTMEIIAGLETEPRGVYTGCIGYLAPGRRAQFNVAIRTVVVDRQAAQAEYGVGGGIVWDSQADDEYRECQIKARVLSEPSPAFELLETMLWRPGEGYFLLDRHLQRLAASAEYFAIPLDLTDLRQKLADLDRSLSDQPHRVRLLVNRRGRTWLQTSPLAPVHGQEPVRVGLAARPVDSADRFLYHKTTRRQVYEQARRSRPDCDDVLLWNERRELTESTIANVVVELSGRLVTPPLSSGLLPGTLRGWLLDRGVIKEQVVPLAELPRCRRIWLINSVRGWREAVLVD